VPELPEPTDPVLIKELLVAYQDQALHLDQHTIKRIAMDERLRSSLNAVIRGDGEFPKALRVYDISLKCSRGRA